MSFISVPLLKYFDGYGISTVCASATPFGRAIGGYDTPGIFQGFEVRIEMSAFFTLKNIIILLIISLVNWIAFMVLPVVTTVEENAKKLLNSKG